MYGRKKYLIQMFTFIIVPVFVSTGHGEDLYGCVCAQVST